MNIQFYLVSGDDYGIEDEVNRHHLEFISTLIDDWGRQYEYLHLPNRYIETVRFKGILRKNK